MSDPNRLDQDPQPVEDQTRSTPRAEPDVRAFVRNLILELAPSADGRRADNPRLLEDLGYHSLALMELAFALEDEFDLQTIDEEIARKILTALDVENHVVNELASTGRLTDRAE